MQEEVCTVTMIPAVEHEPWRNLVMRPCVWYNAVQDKS